MKPQTLVACRQPMRNTGPEINMFYKIIRRPAPMTLGKIKDKGGSKVKATKRGDDML